MKYAIDVGYRHIDTASIYANEKEIGTALNEKIKDGTVKREDMFIVSKLWCNEHNPAKVEKAIKKSLDNFGTDYLDLYLVHWPVAFEDGDDPYPMNAETSKVKMSSIDYVDTWKAMEAVLEKGLTKNIGISNFNSEQVERLLKNCKVKPVCNQVRTCLRYKL